MGSVKKDILIGVLVSLVATFAGAFFYVEYFSNYSFDDTLLKVQQGQLFGKLLSLAAIPNLLVFFVFIKKNQDNRAKGVLLATILIALTTLVIKFF
ncbi:hypothetical protein [uncultured Polaribacter sp.]|mgnify:CR=1 FL=1|uniref:hypothetical protein n=1 Tax=uncultured Polaribacter sp. TaxID=174711 RepID=UPI00261159F3|nr:hypothetical protein [uncultured Polaribacter sp.]